MGKTESSELKVWIDDDVKLSPEQSQKLRAVLEVMYETMEEEGFVLLEVGVGIKSLTH